MAEETEDLKTKSENARASILDTIVRISAVQHLSGEDVRNLAQAYEIVKVKSTSGGRVRSV